MQTFIVAMGKTQESDCRYRGWMYILCFGRSYFLSCLKKKKGEHHFSRIQCHNSYLERFKFHTCYEFFLHDLLYYYVHSNQSHDHNIVYSYRNKNIPQIQRELGLEQNKRPRYKQCRKKRVCLKSFIRRKIYVYPNQKICSLKQHIFLKNIVICRNIRQNFTGLLANIIVSWAIFYVPSIVIFIHCQAIQNSDYWFQMDPVTTNILHFSRTALILNHVVNLFIYGCFDIGFRNRIL